MNYIKQATNYAQIQIQKYYTVKKIYYGNIRASLLTQ
jgi:hypothetical protein